MKTLHQRLQSRISKRRNFIRQQEDALDVLKQTRHNTRSFCELFGVEFDSSGLSEEISHLRTVLGALAEDQKLDKRLKNLVIGQGYMFGTEII